MNNRQTEGKITALYERLSHDDELQGDSNSIINQKRYLEDYAAQHGLSTCVHYTDDGFSGGNFDRPSWKRLIADIEAGKVACVLVKDLSRAGRDYLQTGFYTEVLFRERGVRFIAVANGVDSADESSSEFAPFINIMSEWYLRDCSRKQKAAYQARNKAGGPTTNNVIYGYRKDPDNKHHWLIDEEAAAVVRRIFKLSVNGKGPCEIAGILRDERVEKPSFYRDKNKPNAKKRARETSGPYDWVATTVSCILSRAEYMGHTVNFRNRKESYKDKRSTQLPPEEWTIIENTHEAIIDPETWQMAQHSRKTVKRTDSTGEANPLTGLVYCSDCGAKMYNHKGLCKAKKERRDKDPVSGLYPYDNYQCSTYSLTRRHVEKGCKSHYINTRALRELILDAIRNVSKYALMNEEEFSRKVREESEIRQMDAAKALKRKIDKNKRRSSELDELIRKLYESYALGKLSEKRFETLSRGYEQEQAELETSIEADEKNLNAYETDTDRVSQFLALARKYTDFSELTTPMIYEFIDKIVVYAPEKLNSERTQNVDIYLKYIGKFDVPTSEPTQEELAEQASLRDLRARHRESLRLGRQRKKQRELAPAKDEQIKCLTSEQNELEVNGV